MPVYTAPTKDMQFVLHDVLHASTQDIPGYDEIGTRFHGRGAGGSGQAGDGGAASAERRGRHAGLHAGERDRTHARRVPRRLRQGPGGRLDRARLCRGVRRAGPALSDADRRRRDPVLGEHGVQHVPGPDPRGLFGDPRPRDAGAEGQVAAQDGHLRMDRHDEPDGAALRHRSGSDAHQGRRAGRRHLQDHRPEDLHLRRRPRHGRQHRPPRPRQDPGRAGGHQGRLALHRAQGAGRRRRQPRRAQRRLGRQDRGEDGHPRQFHLRHELRRGRRAICWARRTRACARCSP